MADSPGVLFVLKGLRLGGHMISAASLANALHRQGIEMHVAAPNGPLISRLDDGIEYTPLPAFDAGPRALRAALALRRLLARKSFQVVHAQEYLSALLSLWACRATRTPLVGTVAGGQLPWYSYPPVDELVVYSEELRRGYIEHKGWPASRLALVRGRVDTSLFSTMTPDLRAERPTVALISRFSRDRIDAVLAAVRALATLADRGVCRAVIGGSGSEAWRVEETIRGAGLSHGGLDYLGVVEDVGAVFRDTTLFLGCGRTLLEAMSAGLPCILVGVHGVGGAVNEDSIGAMADFNFSGRHAEPSYSEQKLLLRVSELLTRRADLEKMAVFSRGFVGAHYDVQIGARELAAVYQNVLQARRPARDTIRFGWQLARDVARRALRR